MSIFLLQSMVLKYFLHLQGDTLRNKVTKYIHESRELVLTSLFLVCRSEDGRITSETLAVVFSHLFSIIFHHSRYFTSQFNI